jgi:hypothetical protein
MDIALWDGLTPWAPPEDLTAIAIPDGLRVCPGWSYAEGQFVAPPVGPLEEQTEGL